MVIRIAIRGWTLLIFVVALVTSSQAELEVVSSNETGGPMPQQLVDEIVDEASGIQLAAGTVTTTINTAGDPDSNPLAMCKFTGGLTPPGTLLPQANQNANGNAATRAALASRLAFACAPALRPTMIRRLLQYSQD